MKSGKKNVNLPHNLIRKTHTKWRSTWRKEWHKKRS